MAIKDRAILRGDKAIVVGPNGKRVVPIVASAQAGAFGALVPGGGYGGFPSLPGGDGGTGQYNIGDIITQYPDGTALIVVGIDPYSGAIQTALRDISVAAPSGGGGVDYASQLANDLAVLQAQQAFQAQQAQLGREITPYEQAQVGIAQQGQTQAASEFAQTFGLQQQQFGATLLEQAANRQFQQQQLALQAAMEQNRRREGLLTLANQLAIAAQEMQQQSRMLLSDLQPDPFKFSLAMQNLQPQGDTSFDIYRRQLQQTASQQIPLPNVGGDIGSLQGSVTQLQNILAQPRPVSPVPGLAGGGSAKGNVNVREGGTGKGILVGDGAGIIPGVTEVLELLPNGGVRVIPIAGRAQGGFYTTGSPTFSDPGQLAAWVTQQGGTVTPTGGGWVPTWPTPTTAVAPAPTLDPFAELLKKLAEQQAASDASFQQLLSGLSGGSSTPVAPAPPPGPPPVRFPTAADLQSIDFLTPSFPGTPTISELTPGLREEFGILPEGTPSFPVTGNIPPFQGLLNPFTFGENQYVLPAVHRVASRLAWLKQNQPTIYRVVASAYGVAGVPAESLEALTGTALPPVAPVASRIGASVFA